MPTHFDKKPNTNKNIFENAWLSIKAGLTALGEFLKMGAELFKKEWDKIFNKAPQKLKPVTRTHSKSEPKPKQARASTPKNNKTVTWGENSERSIRYDEINPPSKPKPTPAKGILKKK